MLRDARAAFVTAILSLASSLSTSALIFSGPLQADLGLGTAAALVTATITACVTAFASEFRIAIASPASTVAAALAVSIALLDPAFARMSHDRIVPTVFAILAITTSATGIALLLVGHLRMGKIVRFLPYPVVAGFMGISGWLLASGGFRLTAGMPLSPASLPALMAPHEQIVVAAMIVFALCLLAARLMFANPAIMPGLLVAGVLATNVAVVRIGAADVPSNLMFKSNSTVRVVQPFASDLLLHVDWTAVASIASNILAVILITVLTTLLTCTGLEANLDVDADLDRELRVQGTANTLAALAGGYVGLISIGTTMAGGAAGARSRIVGFINAGVCLAALIGGISLVDDIPRFVVGGLQLEIGAGLLWIWCIESRTRLPLPEWLLVLGIVAVAVWFGFLPAVICGIAGGCVLFAVEMSRVDVVRRTYGLDEHCSSVVRAETELAALANLGSRARIFELEGFIFFGSARQLAEAVRAAVEAESGWIVIDFTKVTGGDSSATAVLGRSIRMLRHRGIALILSGISAHLLANWKNAAIIDDAIVLSPDLDAALEFTESAVLRNAAAERRCRRRRLPVGSQDRLAARNWPTGSCRCSCELISWKAPTCAGRATRPTASSSSSTAGSASWSNQVTRNAASACSARRTIAGEQSFVLRSPRSASLKVEAEATVWSLSRRSFDDLAATDADVVVALLRGIVCVQSERLSFASRQTAALER